MLLLVVVVVTAKIVGVGDGEADIALLGGVEAVAAKGKAGKADIA